MIGVIAKCYELRVVTGKVKFNCMQNKLNNVANNYRPHLNPTTNTFFTASNASDFSCKNNLQ